MVFVVRGELRLTSGKIAAQVAHAAVDLVQVAARTHSDDYLAWERGGAKKIVLVCPTLIEMLHLEREARTRHILARWVEDAGLTEVPPGTRTCLGLGPALASALDAVTGKLDLL